MNFNRALKWLGLSVTVAESAIGLFFISSPSQTVSEFDALGSCIGSDGPIELRRVMFLENRALDLHGSSGPIRVTLRNQSVRMQVLGENSDRSIFIRNIGSIVARGEDDADIFLKLALFENRTFVYWRETFQHRTYRQGMFSIVGHNLTLFCEGEGGVSVSH